MKFAATFAVLAFAAYTILGIQGAPVGCVDALASEVKSGNASTDVPQKRCNPGF